ncbi:trichohyalin-like [Cherax quadricarinatus]|uniref:trichohyalin-like n=1 Tax=Cherax quadricarinatus TaxID=27406 RepID=UPI00387E3D3E
MKLILIKIVIIILIPGLFTVEGRSFSRGRSRGKGRRGAPGEAPSFVALSKLHHMEHGPPHVVDKPGVGSTLPTPADGFPMHSGGEDAQVYAHPEGDHHAEYVVEDASLIAQIKELQLLLDESKRQKQEVAHNTEEAYEVVLACAANVHEAALLCQGEEDERVKLRALVDARDSELDALRLKHTELKQEHRLAWTNLKRSQMESLGVARARDEKTRHYKDLVKQHANQLENYEMLLQDRNNVKRGKKEIKKRFKKDRLRRRNLIEEREKELLQKENLMGKIRSLDDDLKKKHSDIESLRNYHVSLKHDHEFAMVIAERGKQEAWSLKSGYEEALQGYNDLSEQREKDRKAHEELLVKHKTEGRRKEYLQDQIESLEYEFEVKYRRVEEYRELSEDIDMKIRELQDEQIKWEELSQKRKEQAEAFDHFMMTATKQFYLQRSLAKEREYELMAPSRVASQKDKRIESLSREIETLTQAASRNRGLINLCKDDSQALYIEYRRITYENYYLNSNTKNLFK